MRRRTGGAGQGRELDARLQSLRCEKERQLALQAAAETRKLKVETMLACWRAGVEMVRLDAQGEPSRDPRCLRFGLRKARCGPDGDPDAILSDELFDAKAAQDLIGSL